ncbi:bifunctional 4-hydroxy-2-oxoglutarate aldolase/2-dehydro-3-deoxy-phosphogluconate aldolase [Demequina aurantiaca]|uniref:bifunctional 4-hydroxy-2-oxoglutarate aldolase/2-dehydro-3-deoxy-phosphogluconate aldolase n=1 Tax=Demequina aurantiaca TaxID=676200 RepID=UPI0007818A13|nr:bifunctional 4-hydroxy-2-oxoglutarate aldolase/2-dehydro-3-deoxy-phosphogluconate aldolase [Demequina aurantiaca]
MTSDGLNLGGFGKIVPVLVIDDATTARPLAQALAAGGIRCAEITLRTAAAIEAIELVADVPDFLIGAGTVLTADDVDRVVDAGARFVVSPGLDDEVVSRCRHHDVTVIPGVATATEVQRAVRLGLDVLKFFPAEVMGGITTIEQLAGPFPGVRFMPSGGVTPLNVARYAQSTSVFAVSGSWMATRRLVAGGEFSQIARLSREAFELVSP